MNDVETFRDFIIKGCRVRLYRDGRWESLDRKWKWKEPVAIAEVMGKKSAVLMPDGKWVVRKKVSFNPRDYKWGILGMIVYGVLSLVERMCYGIGNMRTATGDDDDWFLHQSPRADKIRVASEFLPSRVNMPSPDDSFFPDDES